ncbi:hypothetical protein GobsT_39630 [Gemmata obscuriglobus]|uniref:Cell division protein FtsQ n=1 Tax=Gemmata obscuriglobus TaxID=114 RepID=A0A2Z3H2M6_9BACT|nr:hypothetical protein [Gemmata obscuriglobus]AWM37967.1 hypothetical protein C1280_13850 [Gemmata obscuriglobus]QEG29173.1 hypothetical protein GobsT_39630 [Gemmata obscuriglobus]VTS07921.1 Uncharacterized protein OS=Planctomyces limnophilus (strain ATCC 43296 / DSM 3776 / IFAM 1008 / 290) GN=Plim_3909 PE=4 SV=1 [Gemmata obscuriglobus UQM 2246]
MKRAKKARPAPPPPRGGRPVLTVVLTLGFAAALLFGLSLLGDQAKRRIGPRDRYSVAFADIRCDPPPGTDRETFLTEVRYTAAAGSTLQLLDPQLKPRLTGAFAAHPWVLRVDSVTIEPPDVVAVALTFRKPVLCVPHAATKRAVDAKGVLLPATAPTDGLPELLGAPALPSNALAGHLWPAEVVVRAAPVAVEYKPKTLERTPQGWQLIMPDGRKLLVAK